jgi:hypothetical protein
MDPLTGAYAPAATANGTPSMQQQIDALTETVQEQALLILKLQLASRDREAKLRDDMERLVQERIAHLSLQVDCQCQETIVRVQGSLEAVSKNQNKHLSIVAVRVRALELKFEGSQEKLEAFGDKFGISTPVRPRNNSSDEECKESSSPSASPPLSPRRGVTPLRKGSVDPILLPGFPKGSLSTQSVAFLQPVASSSTSFVSSSSSSNSVGIGPVATSSSLVRNSKFLASPGMDLRALSRSPGFDPDYVTPRAPKSPINFSTVPDGEPS